MPKVISETKNMIFSMYFFTLTTIHSLIFANMANNILLLIFLVADILLLFIFISIHSTKVYLAPTI